MGVSRDIREKFNYYSSWMSGFHYAPASQVLHPQRRVMVLLTLHYPYYSAPTSGRHRYSPESMILHGITSDMDALLAYRKIGYFRDTIAINYVKPKSVDKQDMGGDKRQFIGHSQKGFCVTFDQLSVPTAWTKPRDKNALGLGPGALTAFLFLPFHHNHLTCQLSKGDCKRCPLRHGCDMNPTPLGSFVEMLPRVRNTISATDAYMRSLPLRKQSVTGPSLDIPARFFGGTNGSPTRTWRDIYEDDTATMFATPGIFDRHPLLKEVCLL